VIPYANESINRIRPTYFALNYSVRSASIGSSFAALRLGHPPADDTERMETMVEFVAEHVDVEELCRHIGQPRQLLMSPPAFRFRMMEQARAANRRIVLPEGDEPRTVEAAAICQSKGIARCVLLAKPEAVREVIFLRTRGEVP